MASGTPKSKKPKIRYLATVPPQEIVPVVDGQYQSSIPGIYVVGDVTGFPLVKVAANQGREVIEKLEASIKSPRPDFQGLDLVIIGAGPAGISAGIEAAKRGWKYVIIERSKAASTVRNFPTGKKVYAEPRSLENKSELDVEQDVDREQFLDIVQDAIGSHQLNLKEETEVTSVQSIGDHEFSVETTDGKTFPCRNVLIAVGRQGQPRLLDVPGADNFDKVTYKVSTVEDYAEKKILVVGGGNSAIEAALLLMDRNDVTLSYRGDNFYRAKEENRKLIDEAIQSGRIKVLFNSQLREIRQEEVVIETADETQTISNDNVVIQIGSLPPIDFLQRIGLELDGIWTAKRFLLTGVGLLVGILVYFFAHYFVLLPPETAENGKWLVPLVGWAGNPAQFSQTATAILSPVSQIITYVLPLPLLALLGLVCLNKCLTFKDKPPLYQLPGAGWILSIGAIVYYLNYAAPYFATLNPAEAGTGPYFLPGFTWIFLLVPDYFQNLYGFYYLLYFSAITFFGIYWAVKLGNATRWKRNLTIIAVQWTLWWGIPTFLVVFLGTNPWTPLLSRSLNAWPLNMAAFEIDNSIVRPGDPEWWYLVGVVGVVWAVFLTFVVIPIFTIKFGKIYCSYICSCGALAETVGNGYRHRGPKGDAPRWLERFGFVFIALASIATIDSLLPAGQSFLGFGNGQLLSSYNFWVGTFLSGAVAIGVYPFLGQRIWCRMWCPLAFWMNFWGRWSKFKITPEKGKCIDCNVCNQYCQMGIDIKSRALKGEPVTLVDTPCVGCAECVMRCPMEILHLGDAPDSKTKLYSLEGNQPDANGR